MTAAVETLLPLHVELADHQRRLMLMARNLRNVDPAGAFAAECAALDDIADQLGVRAGLEMGRS